MPISCVCESAPIEWKIFCREKGDLCAVHLVAMAALVALLICAPWPAEVKVMIGSVTLGLHALAGIVALLWKKRAPPPLRVQPQERVAAPNSPVPVATRPAPAPPVDVPVLTARECYTLHNVISDLWGAGHILDVAHAHDAAQTVIASQPTKAFMKCQDGYLLRISHRSSRSHHFIHLSEVNHVVRVVFYDGDGQVVSHNYRQYGDFSLAKATIQDNKTYKWLRQAILGFSKRGP